YTELGSGFKIAMRDLNIRGAGNLLGKHQSGFIDSVGYELYSEMLESAVKEKQGIKEEEQPVNIPIDTTLDAYIPGTYITHEQSKVMSIGIFTGCSSSLIPCFSFTADSSISEYSS